MKIYKLGIDERGISFRFKYDDDRKQCPEFRGESLKHIWRPVNIVTGTKGTRRDFTFFFSGILAFVGRTRGILEPLIQDYAEFLPVIHDEYTVNLLNVTNILDCVDRERSVEKRISGNILFDYTKLYFYESALMERSTIFRIPDVRKRIFVNDEFFNAVVKHKLKGIEFVEVWDSEVTEEMEKERQARYEAMLTELTHAKGQKYTYDQAIGLVESGKAVAHKQWKLQIDKKGKSMIGTLKEDCTYQWIYPKYIPPIFLELQWHEVEKSDV